MTSRRILVLALVAVLALIGAVLLANQRTHSSQATSLLLFPELKAQAESVKAIRIFKAGDVRALEIVRDGTQWTLTERNGYPVAPAKVRNLVRALTNAKALEEKTSDPSKYSALSVEDVKSADAKGVRIELDGTAKPVNLIVGKDAPGGKSSYVRRVGEQKSWLVNELLSASPEASDWLEKDIINLSADRIQSATIAIEGQKPYSVAKASRADADFKVEPLPKGKELTSPSAANSAATALMSLSLDDVRPKSDVATARPSEKATYKTFDGLVVQLDGYKKDGKHLITISPSYDAALAERFRVKIDANTKAADDAKQPADKAKPTSSTATADVADEAKTSAAKLQNWAYEIPEYKYQAIFRSFDELLKK
jgi:Domain of unknown function (DUF4340)